MLNWEKFLRTLIRTQISWSQAFDQFLPATYRIDGSQDYITRLVPIYLRPYSRVYDIGGGKHPIITPEQKQQLDITVIGMDIDQRELEQAPDGVYEETICADITRYTGKEDADFVLCHALLEHVENVASAFAGIVSVLKPGGIAIIFVPSRNALYARLNLLLPERVKKYLLDVIFPQAQQYQGFKSFYNQCTPRKFEEIAKRHGLDIHSKYMYFCSSYFSCFFPVYVIWRIWILVFHYFCEDQAAETFAMICKKRPDS